ncbi:transcription factor RFX4-like [Anneissia japonica]|uniref:transcription factor RFX4-like n=1 Tax=Anneissia japonica TaxID=1529436 RepID=UPI001425B9AC|nr:transcription factor RFX4-like [Anneissia japonica]XP_033102226.1 transcription factor RFX4-like [Anneissia japonica]
MELEAFKEVKSRRSEGSKPHSTPSTLAWLDENYELAEGVCIPRSSLYFHYMDFCEKTDTIPVNAASFGKIIRQQFSQLTTRRLGTRGQSKYHYYGIAIKESSVYYEAMYSKSGAPGVGSESTKKDAAKQNIAYSPRSKLGTLLPEFPDIRDINLPPNVPEAKVSTFIMMYRTHCQRILDTVIRANFDEVQNYLLHFWQGMPSHIIPILDSTSVVNIVGVCDSILYKAIASVLMPSVLQALPDSLTQVIRKFAYELDDWLKFALSNLPENLRLVKFQVSKGFTELLKLQTSLNHLCQASKTVIHNSDIVSQMLEDWELVDFPGILQQTMYTLNEHRCEDIVHLIVNFYQEFECLLDDHASIESYTEWLDSIIDRGIVKPSTDNSFRLEKLARFFLLNWSSVSTRIIRDLTLHSAPSFGSYHLMHLMFDDYVTYSIGMLLAQSRAIDLKESLKRQTFVGS